MCDETVAGSDVILDSNVSVSATKYDEIVRTVNSQDIKLKAMRNLHQIIQSKDQELKASCEKVQNLQAALDKAEMRLANQIRLTVSGAAHQSTLEADCVGQDVALPAEQCLDKPLSRTTSTIRQATDKLQQSSASSSDLEEDCACDPVPECRRTVADNFQKLTSPYHQEHMQKSRTLSRESTSAVARLGDSPALQSRGVKLSPPPSFESVGKVESLAGLDSMEKVSLSSGSQSLKSIGATTGFSRDLLDKLMQQNARLKKVIRDILHQKGTSFEDYLDRQESQDVITQLRDDLRLTKAQNERLKDVINSRDSEDISKKYSELSENFQKLKRTATMMHAMADSYSKEYEKLKVENKDLKEELSTANQKRKSLELRQQSNGGTTLPMSAGAEGTISMSSFETLKLHCDEVSMKLISAEAEVEALRLQLQQQLLNEEVQRKTADEMRKQCENLSTEKDLLKTQLTVFQEDFTVEERKHADKRQQLESSIAKHQDWIRKLVAEAQKSRSLFEEEKGKREKAETAKGEVEKRFRSFINQDRSASSNCGLEDNWQRGGGGYNHHMYHEDLQVDNGGDSAPSSSSSIPPFRANRLQSQPSNEATFEHEQSGPLVCPRCEREFEAKDEQKWKDHCARCTDD